MGYFVFNGYVDTVAGKPDINKIKEINKIQQKLE